MSVAPKYARILYLELSALEIDVHTGSVPELRPLSCSEIAALMRRVRENRTGLREVMLADAFDLAAIRREGAP